MLRILVVCSSFFFSHWKYMFVDQYPSPIKLTLYGTVLAVLKWLFKKKLYRFVLTHYARPSKFILQESSVGFISLVQLKDYVTHLPVKFLQLFCHIWQVKRKPVQRNIMNSMFTLVSVIFFMCFQKKTGKLRVGVNNCFSL